MLLKKISEIAICKSLIFNLRHFGTKGLKMPVLIARKCRLAVKGKVQLCSFQFGIVKIGFGGSPAIVEKAYSRFAVKKNAVVVFNGKAGISAGTSICVDKGTLVVGENFSTNKNCLIACSKGIQIGNDVTLGWNVNVRDNDGHTVVDEVTGVASESKEVKIGNHVWLCAYADVLKGSTIPDDSVVAYRSLVTKAFDRPSVLIGGVPAKILKENIRWYY